MPVPLHPQIMRSRLGRRLLALFVMCALAPTLALAVVAFTFVSDSLQDASHRRLQQTSKSIGMSILERLVFVEGELRAAATRLESSAAFAPELEPELAERFAWIQLEPDGAPPRPLLGGSRDPAPLERAQRERLAHGDAVLALVPRGPDAVGVILAVPAARGTARLIAEIRAAYLTAPAADAIDPESGRFCLASAGRVIACLPDAERLLPPGGSAIAGAFETRVAGDAYLGHYWSLFLEGNYGEPSWTVAVGEQRDQALGALPRFSRSFGLVALASLLCALLLSTGQIRRSLVPLQRLREGTRRLAAQDFAARVEVRSGDELEDLAVAFNAMAERLGRQFRALAARSELDRAILSSMDLGTIVDTVLGRIPALCPCDVVALVLLDAASATTARSYVADAVAPGRVQRENVVLDLDAIRRLQAESEVEFDSAHAEVPGYLRPLVSRGARHILVLPIALDGQLAALVALGSAAPWSDDEEGRLLARQLADQVAVAFANAHMLERVRFLAYHDPLTKLPNRRRFKEHLAQSLDQARRRETSLAVLFFDLDDFKRINDTLGHGIGDELLKAVARRVKSRLERAPAAGGPSVQALSRLGGDEFTLLATGFAGVEEAGTLAEQLLRSLSEPFRLGRHEVFISGSVGIALHPLDGEDASVLLRNADTAMHHAKDLGKNRHQFYTRSMNEAAVERLTLEVQLRHALERGEFELYYQPIVDLRSGRLAGAEALVRWNHPELGLVLPARFIPVAEESGLIVPLGEWVLKRACETARGWERTGRLEVPVAVNLSSRQFREEKLTDTVISALASTGLDPRRLGLEITESMLMRADPENIDTLRRLRELGIRVAVDDFGTGYSSLSYLKHFPVDSLKIDRSFVRDLANESDDAAITRAVIALGRSMQLRVVAEGVETQEQLEFLRSHGCDSVQGFLLGAPVPADAFAESFLDGRWL